MTARILGRIGWTLQRNHDGHRTYRVKWLVKTDDYNDGPQNILNCPGLPTIGTYWQQGNDIDFWALCSPEMMVNRYVTPHMPGLHWTIDQSFSTLPMYRCQDNSVNDPLQEPPKISGSYIKYMKEAKYDRSGALVTNSALEPFRGKENEWDANRPGICIEMNFLNLGTDFGQYMDYVNDSPIWDFPKRCVKLSGAPWQRKLYGTCSYYFTVRYEFDVRMNQTLDGTVIGHDRQFIDHGRKVLRGQWIDDVWTPDAGTSVTNPKDFIRWKDAKGEICDTLLNGFGGPLTNSTNPVPIYFGAGVPRQCTEVYGEFNMLSLGVPASLTT